MNLRIVGILLLIKFGETKLEESYKLSSTQSTPNDINLPQLSTLQKFQRSTLNYIIPIDEAYNDFYIQYINRNPTANNITSPNYPEPYPSDDISKYTININASAGIEIVIHFLDLDPNIDFLKVNTESHVKNKGSNIIVTGKLDKPLQLRAIGIYELNIEFHSGSNPDHTHKGFLLTYSPFGMLPETTTEASEDVTLPVETLDTLTKMFSISQNNQNNKTWAQFRSLLCNAADNFTIENNLSFEECQTENITFVSILQCPTQWPDYINCVVIKFAISLYNETFTLTTEDPMYEENEDIRMPDGLSSIELELMWDQIGKFLFRDIGILEYTVPDSESVLLLWAGISASVIVIFLIILTLISRMETFHDYLHWNIPKDEKQNILNDESKIDFSMIPSRHQVVPPLFPANSNSYNTSGNDLSQYDQEKISFSKSIVEVDTNDLHGLRSGNTLGPDESLMNNQNKLNSEFYVKGGNAGVSLI